MSTRLIPAEALRGFVERALCRVGYSPDQAVDGASVLLWASLRGVDTHGVRNLKPYYIDRTLDGQLNPCAQIRAEHQTPFSARLDGDSGLGLAGACHAMRMAIDKARQNGVGMVSVRNMHHLGPAGYFAHMAIEKEMIGICLTGHFFGKGHYVGIAPGGSTVPMLSTNPLSFAAPCGRYAPFVLDMSTSVATVNRIEMHAQEGRSIPRGWACDANGVPTTDPSLARLLLPLGGTPELGGHKGAGLAMMVSILTGVLSGAWSRQCSLSDEPSKPDRKSVQFDQPTMGHFFAAVRIEAFQPFDSFQEAMEAMIDALHNAPVVKSHAQVQYPGERESATAVERSRTGIPVSDRLFAEFQTLADQFDLELP